MEESGRRKYLTPAAIARIGNLQLVARLVVEGAMSGQHKSPDFGFNVEFSEHRRYMPGDELKHIDWKLYAKSDKYFVKLYEENTALRAYLLLDVSASMTFGRAGWNKLEYGKCILASLAYLLLHQKDAVGCASFSDHLHDHIAPSSKATHLGQIVGLLQNAEPSGQTDLFKVLQELVGKIRRRALVVIVSDFFDEPERILTAVRFLRFLKHEVILLRVLTPEEIEFPFESFSRFVDLEDGSELLVDPRSLATEYREAIHRHLKEFRRRCAYAHVDTELFRTDRALEESLARFLNRRACRRTA